MAPDPDICQKMHGRMNAFLDDLLAEEEYQEIHGHLEICSDCRNRMEAVGSFWHHIQELGRVEVPEDFAATVLFRLQSPQGTHDGVDTAARKRLLPPRLAGVVGIVLICMGLVWLAQTFLSRPQPPSSANPPEVTTQILHEPKPADEEEAKILYQKLNVIAKALGPSQTKSENQETVAAEGTSQMPTKESSTPQTAFTEIESTVIQREHWHFRYQRPTTLTHFMDRVGLLGIRVRFRGASTLVLEAKGDKMESLRETVRHISDQASPLIHFSAGRGSLDQTHWVSIFLQNLSVHDPDVYHWHLRFSLGNDYRLGEILRRSGAMIKYETRDAVIVELERLKLNALIDQIKDVEGIIFKPESVAFAETVAEPDPVNISIFIEFSKDPQP